jgi:hypothetical protein
MRCGACGGEEPVPTMLEARETLFFVKPAKRISALLIANPGIHIA